MRRTRASVPVCGPSTGRGPDRVNLVAHAESGRIQVAQKPIPDGSFCFEDALGPPNVDPLPRHRLQHAQVDDLVRGNLVRLEHFRTPEEIPLELIQLRLKGRFKLLARFYFPRQLAVQNRSWRKTPSHLRAHVCAGSRKLGRGPRASRTNYMQAKASWASWRGRPCNGRNR